jgi:hypothetical protein
VDIPAINNTKWVQYVIYANDTDTGHNETTTLRYHIDAVLPTIHTPYTQPTYPNASIPIWLLTNITDFVGIQNVTVYYKWGASSFTTAAFEQASDVDSLTVGAWLRVDDASYFDSLHWMGDRLGTWNATVSGRLTVPPPELWTSVDVILLDGSGSSYLYDDAIAAAQNGAYVVTDRNTFLSARSRLGNPSYTGHNSNGYTTYGMTVGRGAIVYTNNIYNRYYLGMSYDRYSNATLNSLSDHLKDAHHRFMPYGVLVPKTTVSSTVDFKYHITDKSNLTYMSDLMNFTTDGVNPVITGASLPPVPPLKWVNETHPAWVNIPTRPTSAGPT